MPNTKYHEYSARIILQGKGFHKNLAYLFKRCAGVSVNSKCSIKAVRMSIDANYGESSDKCIKVCNHKLSTFD